MASKMFYHYPASNTEAIIGDDASGGAALTDPDPVITGIDWSYDAAPTGGRLSITVDTVVVYDIDIIAGGPGGRSFDDLHLPAVATDLDITLAAGGVGITGKLNVFAK